MTNRVFRPILRCRLFTTARGGVPCGESVEILKR